MELTPLKYTRSFVDILAVFRQNMPEIFASTFTAVKTYTQSANESAILSIAMEPISKTSYFYDRN